MGMSDMGGVKHFNIAVQTPNGDLELMKELMAGANKEVDESAEERKGGAGGIGKCFYSAGDDQVRSQCLAWCVCVLGSVAGVSRVLPVPAVSWRLLHRHKGEKAWNALSVASEPSPAAIEAPEPVWNSLARTSLDATCPRPPC